MINLLPYSRRVLLKSLYKKRLVVVAIFGFTAVLIPIVLVLVLLSYLSYQNVNNLNIKYASLENLRKQDGIDDLNSEVKKINTSIKNFKSSVSSVKPISLTIEKIISSKPDDIKIISFEFTSGQEKNDNLIISGVSGSRDSIIKYGDILGLKGDAVCSNVEIPINTYIKKNNVPFTIKCDVKYEAK